MSNLIIVIEDDDFLRELIVAKLQKEKYKVIFATDGEEGLKKIREEKPDLVLLDIIMPGMSGFEVLEEMKKDSDISSIPVIILSNLGQINDVKRGIALGAIDYVIKAHFTPNEIIEVIKKYI
jgi:DNA-binding response OmpR family regulator